MHTNDNVSSYKYFKSDVNFCEGFMRKDKSDTNLSIFSLDPFQNIFPCKIIQHYKHLPIKYYFILFETDNNTKTTTRLYHEIFHSLLQQKIL